MLKYYIMKYTVITSVLFSLLAAILFLVFYPVPVVVQPSSPHPIIIASQPPQRPPEFRGPPLKRYKPGRFQQMGLLKNDEGEMLPLYGRESRTHRDRYHYYTTTSGDQIFPLNITVGDRDCSEDVGCQELYGNETVNVNGSDNDFSVDIYRTENFPRFY